MNHWIEKKLVAESPNVERLPSAAPRMVNNFRCAEQRRAGGKRRREEGAIFPHRWPTERHYLKRGRIVKSIERTPALVLLDALLKSLPAETRKEVQTRIEVAIQEGQDCKSHDQALEFAIHSQPMETHDQAGMNFAFAELTQETAQ